MSGEFSRRAATLREEFDSSFAVPRTADAPEMVDVLMISVGTAPYAIPLNAIASLSTGLKITPIPGQAAVLGLAGFRGVMLPVFGLAALLGHDTDGEARWLVRTPIVAFAFSQFDYHLRLAVADIVPQVQARAHVRGYAEHAGVVRPVLNMASLHEAVRILAAEISREQDQT